MTRLSRLEIVSRLREISLCRVGGPFPKWMSPSGSGMDWGPPLSDLCGQAADLLCTPIEMLDAATKDFEATFKQVHMGNLTTFFVHDGKRYDYIEVVGQGIKPEGISFEGYDTAEDAVFALRTAWKEFEGKKHLYWRVRPEIEQDIRSTTREWTDSDDPNPNFGKWKTYSRFRAID